MRRKDCLRLLKTSSPPQPLTHTSPHFEIHSDFAPHRTTQMSTTHTLLLPLPTQQHRWDSKHPNWWEWDGRDPEVRKNQRRSLGPCPGHCPLFTADGEPVFQLGTPQPFKGERKTRERMQLQRCCISPVIIRDSGLAQMEYSIFMGEAELF